MENAVLYSFELQPESGRNEKLNCFRPFKRTQELSKLLGVLYNINGADYLLALTIPTLTYRTFSLSRPPIT